MPYKTLGRVYHNGKKYGVGEEIQDLRESEAERLLSLGVIEGEDDHSEEEVYLTPEEFKAIKDDAKRIGYLEHIGLTPAETAADQLKQYKGWYDPSR
ncbi:hypothetical protein ACFWMP_13870 [Paenibacillus sp. NPDC058367]|uniref:DUF7210 family protein n=1 Tax=Paenibacillus sp. NPDC058367 TaxID=3346460 RepID=UPI003654EB5A